jgi:hypothetical protein
VINKTSLLAATFLGVLGFSLPAFAQLEEIVVTATKREHHQPFGSRGRFRRSLG